MKRWTMVFLFITIVLCGTNPVSAKSLTYGNGPTQVMLFTDFFCAPCQMLEEMIGGTLDNLVYTNMASVTFVPVPMSQKSMVAAMHLLSVADGKPYKEVVAQRVLLYNMAKSGMITNDLLNQWTREYKGKTNLAPYVKTLSDIIMSQKVTSTPTCIIRYSNGKTITYKGAQDIYQALKDLKGAS